MNAGSPRCRRNDCEFPRDCLDVNSIALSGFCDWDAKPSVTVQNSNTDLELRDPPDAAQVQNTGIYRVHWTGSSVDLYRLPET